jgi:colanic acid biosynthesis glycosyl transferase WcaI
MTATGERSRPISCSPGKFSLRILIYGLNYAPERTGVGKYTTEMAEWLQGRGHQVRVVTAPPYYPAWKVGAGYTGWSYRRESLNGIDVFRCPLWVPANPNGFRRILHLLSFAVCSIPVMLRQISWRPDRIIVIEPTLFCAPCALITARMTHAKAWLHIQDFEVEAFFGLGFGSGGFVKKCVNAVEGWLMRRFDHVSSISRQMAARLSAFGIPEDRISIFPNWVDTDRIRPGIRGRAFREEWGLGPERKIVLYAGSMGNKQGLEMVLETARALRNDDPDIFFLLVGEGSAKEGLVQRAHELGLQNVLFKPPQLPEDFPELLALANVHLVVQKKGVSEAFMPSKLTGILAAGGTAIITADEDTELGRLVKNNPGIAVLVPPENQRLFREALRTELSKNRNGPGINLVARNYAERHLARDGILSHLEKALSTWIMP